jgi:hypothetical protein
MRVVKGDILPTQKSGKRGRNGTQRRCMVDIPKDGLGFFGGAGKMLLPAPATVVALIEKVPGAQTHHD